MARGKGEPYPAPVSDGPGRVNGADPQERRRVGLCARCTNARRITSAKGSTFWMCNAPGLPKYPPLPVVRCVAFAPAAPAG